MSCWCAIQVARRGSWELKLRFADYGDADALPNALGEGGRVFMVSLWIGGETRLDLHRRGHPLDRSRLQVGE
jgi:hypothetical protein